MKLLSTLWAEEKARPPIILLSLIIGLSLLWFIFGGSSEMTANEAPETFKEVLVKGMVENTEAVSVDPLRPVTVHLSIPELAYQRDAVVVPDENGSFEIPLQLPAEKLEYHFDLDLSQGTSRWRVLSNQTLQVEQSKLELEELPLEPPKGEQRAALPSREVGSSESRAEAREKRRQRREERKEQRRRRRGRAKKK